jgi:gliding motility-associated-like protein
LNLLPLVTTDPTLTTFRWEVTDVNGIGTAGQFDGTGTAINQLFTNNSDASATMLYQITPIGPGGCEGTPKIINVSVAPTITAAFVSVNEGVCEGTPIFLTFELHGQPPFEFTYNEIKPSGTILHTVTKSGNIKVEKVIPTVTTTYEIVSVKDALNCSVTIIPKQQVTFTVFKAVTAKWTANIPPFIGGNSKVTFTNTSTVLDPTQFRYEWSFGTDAAPSPLASTNMGPTIDVNYNRPGDHYVTLRVINLAAEATGQSCESTYSAKITIPVLPLVSDFKFSPSSSCFPQNIKVTENTATGNTMDWKVYDGNGRVIASSGAPLPEFLISTPGEYTIILKTSDSFTGQTAFSPTKEFTVYGNPVASFQARPTILFVPDTELITANFSTGATEYEWEFGDGGTSDERTPTHFYKIEGIYEIMMIAKNDHGGGVVCKDTLVQKVTAKQGGVTKVPNAFTPSTTGPSGGRVANGAGDMNNDVFLPFVKGVEEFNMEIFDRWGNLLFESNSADTGWDGYDKNGRLMQSGVYVYKLTLRLSDGQRTTQLGDITLIR